MGKKIIKNLTIILIFILSIGVFSVFCACDGDAKERQRRESDVLESTKLPSVIQNINDGFITIDQVISQAYSNDGNNSGIIECPYYTVKFSGGKDGERKDGTIHSYSVPLYKQELLSFGYIEATSDMFPITVTLSSKYSGWDINFARVIPMKYLVETNVLGGTVTFQINDFNTYTVLFNDAAVEFKRPFTLFVKEHEEIDVPEGYDLIEFEAGLHYLNRIVNNSTGDGIKSKTFIYLHPGAYLVAKMPDIYSESHIQDSHGHDVWKGFVYFAGQDDLIVKGHGVIDLSALPLHARTPFEISSANNVTLEGFTLINSSAWTIQVRNCTNVNINNIALMSYKINSDGIAICNTQDATVKNSFVCSGDDLFEVKAVDASSMSGTGGNNILFDNCQAWALKTRAFGFIQESEMDVSDVTFNNCSVIYHDADFTMSDAFTSMGAFVVVVGDVSTIKNITFRSCDTYYADKYQINIVLADNAWTTSECKGKIENITFEGMSFSDWKSGIQIVNYKKSNSDINDVKNIIFKDIYVGGTKQTLTEIKNQIHFYGSANSSLLLEDNENGTLYYNKATAA